MCPAIISFVLEHPQAAAAITTFVDREVAGYNCAWSPSCDEMPAGGSAGFLLGKASMVAPTVHGPGGLGSASAAEANWSLGGFKSPAKWASQMERRGWTSTQISEAIEGGESFPAQNLVNRGNGATRYVNPTTGRSVVIDDKTREVIHIGGDGFKYE